MKAFKKRIRSAILRTKVGNALLAARNLQPYLKQTGWMRSVREIAAVDSSGSCIPWITYPALHFLSERIHSEMKVFEYGSGNSTIWWSSKVSCVVSCEHDAQWHVGLKPKLPNNVDYLFHELHVGGDYAKSILKWNKEFDIVCIDGRDRVNCAINAVAAMRDDGVILWDNSERPKYAEGYAFLNARGFKRIDFYGLGPLNGFGWCTTIFYRPSNCLGI